MNTVFFVLEHLHGVQCEFAEDLFETSSANSRSTPYKYPKTKK